MTARPRVWWQKVKQHPVVAIFVFVGIALVILVIALGYLLNWHWTGLVPETSDPKQHAKTLWDWLDLLGVLAIPVVVALGAAWYTAQQGKVSERENTDNQRGAALQKYIDSMSELLLHEKLRDSQPEDEVRTIARVRTLTVLRRLDAERKGSVLLFLHESGLIDKDKRIIDLSGADLDEANLFNANLSGANLNGTNLSGANLRFAAVTPEQLDKAKSLKSATMPDGSTHP